MDDDPEDLGTVDVLRDAVTELRAAREFLEGQGPSEERDAVLAAVKESLTALLRVLPKDEGKHGRVRRNNVEVHDHSSIRCAQNCARATPN